MRALLLFGMLAVSLIGSTLAKAAETLGYSYDARGRTIRVAHSGTVNNGMTTTYSHDVADNRTQATTAGAPH